MFHKKHYIPVFIYYYEITVLQLDQMGSSIQGNAMFLCSLCDEIISACTFTNYALVHQMKSV